MFNCYESCITGVYRGSYRSNVILERNFSNFSELNKTNSEKIEVQNTIP